MKKVTIYSTPTCHYCEEAKTFLTKFNVKYAAIDVSKDLEQRKEMIKKSNQMGVPVITVGKEVFVGFNWEVKGKLVKLLDIKLN